MSDILACRCSNCGDTWDLGSIYNEMDTLKRINYITTKKKCLRCGQYYMPLGGVVDMYDFVFDAVRTVKM